MASQDQSFSSNNPFRRKSSNPPLSSPENSATALSFSSDAQPQRTTPRPPFTTFKSALPQDKQRQEAQEEDNRPIQPKPKKIVKKVRVQSPPPSSPEDSVPVTRFSPQHDNEDNDSSDSRDDEWERDNTFASIPPPGKKEKAADSQPLPRIPPNPFARTIEHLEQAGRSQGDNAPVADTSKGALDVDSFKRLLLTGYANIPGPASAAAASTVNPSSLTQPQPALHDSASTTDASSVSRQSIFDMAQQESPRSSHEVYDPEEPDDLRKAALPASPLATSTTQTSSSTSTTTTRKKPPPPSSRHGKLIKIELGTDPNNPRTYRQSDIVPLQSPAPTTDVNKPLPLPPLRVTAEEEGLESPFDREAAGKVPEGFANMLANPRPPTPPPTTRDRSASQTSTQSRRSLIPPAAPPPRRQAKADSRPPSINTTTTEEDAPRSSLESGRSRTDSIRAGTSSERPSFSINIPAPPPPRRPQQVRQGSALTSPSITSPRQLNFTTIPVPSPGFSDSGQSSSGLGFTSQDDSGAMSDSMLFEKSSSQTTLSTSKEPSAKFVPPPPPPARHTSTRRPSNLRSPESGGQVPTARKASREKDGGAAPPPPPPRTRSSINRAGVVSPTSAAADDTRLGGGEVNLSSVEETEPSAPADKDGRHGEGILADLSELQREVEEAMKSGTR